MCGVRWPPPPSVIRRQNQVKRVSGNGRRVSPAPYHDRSPATLTPLGWYCVCWCVVAGRSQLTWHRVVCLHSVCTGVCTGVWSDLPCCHRQSGLVSPISLCVCRYCCCCWCVVFLLAIGVCSQLGGPVDLSVCSCSVPTRYESSILRCQWVDSGVCLPVAAVSLLLPAFRPVCSWAPASGTLAPPSRMCRCRPL